MRRSGRGQLFVWEHLRRIILDWLMEVIVWTFAEGGSALHTTSLVAYHQFGYSAVRIGFIKPRHDFRFFFVLTRDNDIFFINLRLLLITLSF